MLSERRPSPISSNTTLLLLPPPPPPPPPSFSAARLPPLSLCHPPSLLRLREETSSARDPSPSGVPDKRRPVSSLSCSMAVWASIPCSVEAVARINTASNCLARVSISTRPLASKSIRYFADSSSSIWVISMSSAATRLSRSISNCMVFFMRSNSSSSSRLVWFVFKSSKGEFSSTSSSKSIGDDPLDITPAFIAIAVGVEEAVVVGLMLFFRGCMSTSESLAVGKGPEAGLVLFRLAAAAVMVFSASGVEAAEGVDDFLLLGVELGLGLWLPLGLGVGLGSTGFPMEDF
mmetsp:Transcript_43014/g.69792  ORF Transcript_43014/g.69792 Transcript_43014/m.69792 type:complete len:290 (-) Transcript_43014:1843-2712(-)